MDKLLNYKLVFVSIVFLILKIDWNDVYDNNRKAKERRYSRTVRSL
jgi:hypothetical protein